MERSRLREPGPGKLGNRNLGSRCLGLDCHLRERRGESQRGCGDSYRAGKIRPPGPKCLAITPPEMTGSDLSNWNVPFYLWCNHDEDNLIGNWDGFMTEAKIIEVGEGDITCPTCGTTIMDDDGPGIQPSCAHVRFIYCNGEAFEYIEPELEKELSAEAARAEEKGELFDTWDALRARTGPDSIILEQTETGMACGPISFTIWVGIRTATS